MGQLQQFVHEKLFKMEADKAYDLLQALRTLHESEESEGVERENGLISDIVPSCVVGDYNIGDVWHRARNYLHKNKSQKFYGHSAEWWKEQTKDIAMLVEEQGSSSDANKRKSKRRRTRR